MILFEIDWRERIRGARQFKVALTRRVSLTRGLVDAAVHFYISTYLASSWKTPSSRSSRPDDSASKFGIDSRA